MHMWVENGGRGRQHKAPPPLRKVHILMSESVNMLHGNKDFADVDKVKDLEIGRLLWSIQVGQYNHDIILKVEEGGRRD